MGGWQTLTVAKKYDPSAKFWVVIAPMRQERHSAGAACLRGKIYVIGGRVWKEPKKSAEFYDPDNDTWTEIASMNNFRSGFRVCIANDRLYAIAGDEKEENGFYEHSIEVYAKNRWMIVGEKIKITDSATFSIVWPYAQFQGEVVFALAKCINEKFDHLRSKHILEEKKSIGPNGGKIEISGCKVSLPIGAMEEDKEITFTARIDLEQEKESFSVTPIVECDPPVTFRKPVSIVIKTCISAQAGETIPVTLFTRKHPGDEWTETQELNIRERNEVEFQTSQCGGMKITSKSPRGKFHLISDFYIHSQTSQIAVVFSKDQAIHDLMQKTLLERNFLNFAVGFHEVIGNLGSEISLVMDCKHPTQSNISEDVFPSSNFTVDEDFLQRCKHVVYYELEPEPPNECRQIKILYACAVDGELEHSLPLKSGWPPINRKTGSCSGSDVINKYIITANQVAISGGTINTEGATNIAGRCVTSNNED